jgi:hypothetical protein
MNMMALIKDKRGYWQPRFREDHALFLHITSGLTAITEQAVARFQSVARAHGTMLAPVRDEEVGP